MEPLIDELEEEEEVREEIIPGVARALSPLVRRILATNPGARTGIGTNTYLVGIDEIVVIDPGPDDSMHRRSITGCGGDRIRWIMLTSGRPEHAAGAQALKEETGAIILAAPGTKNVEADETLKDGYTLVGTEFRLKVHYTPGTDPQALCLELPEEKLIFSGDLIVEGGPMAVMAPEGNMADYLASLAKMKKIRLQRIAPGHGYIIEEPKVALQEWIDHRLEREAHVLDAVKELDGAKADEICNLVYGTPKGDFYELAHGTVEAHLLKLKDDGKVKARAGKYTLA